MKPLALGLLIGAAIYAAATFRTDPASALAACGIAVLLTTALRRARGIEGDSHVLRS